MQISCENKWASLQLQIVALAWEGNFEGQGEYLKEVKSAYLGRCNQRYKETWWDGFRGGKTLACIKHDWMQQMCMSRERSSKFGKSIIMLFPVLKNRLPGTPKDYVVREHKG